MPFVKFPLILFLFLVLFTDGTAIPFVFVAFGILFLLGVARQMPRYEPRPSVSTDELDDLRTDVAISLLEADDDERLNTNTDARSRVRAASGLYTKASTALDRGVRRRDRGAVAKTLYRARYELEAASAELEGRSPPEPPDARPPKQQVAVATRPSSRRRQYRRHICGW